MARKKAVNKLGSELKSEPLAQKETLFVVSLQSGDNIYSTNSVTIIEGIEALKEHRIKTKAVLKVQHDNKQSMLILYPNLSRRLNMNRIYREILSKRLLIALR